jgi:hypothetical protein
MAFREARVLGPHDGRAGMLGSMGVRFMLGADQTGGGFALVEHAIPAHALAAPLHRHSREDEYSFVLEGRIGALLGERLSLERFAISSSSLAGSGTRSGMRVTNPHASSS